MRAKWRRSSEQRWVLSERRRALEVFTSAEGEMQLGRRQTQMLGCLLRQNSFQRKRQIEIEIHYIDPGIVLVKYVRRFLLFVFLSVSLRYNKHFLSLSVCLSTSLSLLPLICNESVSVMREMSPPNTVLTDCFPHQQ